MTDRQLRHMLIDMANVLQTNILDRKERGLPIPQDSIDKRDFLLKSIKLLTLSDFNQQECNLYNGKTYNDNIII